MTSLNRPITRVTSAVDRRTRQPFVVRLEAGGQLLRIRPRRSRTWFTITFAQVWQLACATKAQEDRQEKLRRRLERRAVRRSLASLSPRH